MAESEENRNDINSKMDVCYPYAEMILQEIKDEYAIERAREDKIESKAATFLGAVIAILGLYIPSIPFEDIHEFYCIAYKNEIIISSILIIGFGLGIIAMIVSFIFLQKVYGIKGHPRVRIKGLRELAHKSALPKEADKDSRYLELIDHYCDILCGWEAEESESKSDENDKSRKISLTAIKDRLKSKAEIANQNKGDRDINNESAKLVRRGMMWMIISFVLITLSTIGLRIVVVIPE